MNATLVLCGLTTLVLQIATIAPAHDGPAYEPAAPGKNDELDALEQKLLGRWKGPACGGDYTFNPDGTFDLQHYTPGNHTITGSWSVRWDALPPTLVLVCNKSDSPEYVGIVLEPKLVELNSEGFAYRFPDTEWISRFSRQDDEPGNSSRE